MPDTIHHQLTLPLTCLVALSLVCLAPSAAAQLGRTPSDGLALPERSVTVREDALSLEVNPAGLAFVDGFDGGLVFSSHDRAVEGAGLFLAFGGLGPVGLGGSVQWLDNPLMGGPLKKFSLGFAGQLLGRVSLGLAHNFFDSNVDREVDDFTSWDAGLQIRLWEHFGIGGTVRDFNTPRLGEAVVEPRYTLGGAFRFAQGRYRSELEAVYDGGLDAWYLAARAYAEPLWGLSLFAEVRSSALDDFGVASLHGGLTFAVGAASVTSSVLADLEGSGRVAGTSTVLRVVSRPLRSVLEPRGFMAGISLTGTLPERGRSGLLMETERSFLDLMVRLDDLRSDTHTTGLVLRLENVGLGLGQHWELRRALERLQASGKEVVVFLSTADFGDLYVASAADRVYLAPGTPLFPAGLSTTLTYLGGLFENLGIAPEFVRIGDYKSAAERFTEMEPSPQTLEFANAYLDDVFEHMVDAIAEGRGTHREAILALLDEVPISPEEARRRGLVDDVRFFDELEQALSAHYGRRTFIARDYDPRGWRSGEWVAPPRVAVVYVDGNIIEGTSGQIPIIGLTSGHRTLTQTLEEVRRDGYAAVILRVDSPGGSAFASEAIWRAVERTDAVLPVVVSMGNVAASGGYYVSAGAREILATDVTLTGSIGIFAGHFAARDLFEWAGIHRYPLARGAHTNLFGIDEPWTEAQREAVMRDIQILYDIFLERVASGRDRTAEEIDAVGRGRIWSGARARDLGLVDASGGLLDALDRARDLAGLAPGAPVRLVQLPARRGLLGLVSFLGMRGEVALDPGEAEGLTSFLQSLGLDRALRIPLLYGGGRPAARLEFEVEGLE